MKKHSRCKALISLDAIEENFASMKHNIKEGTKVIAVIKADAYGHGANAVAHLVEDHDYIWGFATATAEEAIALRHDGIQKPILILGVVFEEDLEELAALDVRLAIMDHDSAEAYAKAASRVHHVARIHLALDTGMTRIGMADNDESVRLVQDIARIPNLEIEGMFTHFARADEEDSAPAYVQLNRYLDFSEKLEKAGISIPYKHCSNSAGILRMPEANLDIVRAGITIYGVYPSEEVERDVRLRPAMSLLSQISYLKDVPKGVEVSYGGTFVTSRKNTRIATIPVGYADGYPRLLSNKGWVLIRGRKAPILGRVCMDQFMVDVTDIPDAQIGDRVTLLGKDGEEEITADLLGDLSGRFSYELLCDISKRVPRVYVRDGKEIAEITFLA